MEDFNTRVSIDRSPRQRGSYETLELTDVINQMDLTDIYRTFHPNKEKHLLLCISLELSPKLTTYLDAREILTDTRKLK